MKMDALDGLVGVEKDLDEISRALKYIAQDLRPATTGAMHVTCSDESEHEAQESFQRNFIHHLLPSLKFGHQAAFRVANLAGRYEWNSGRIAENHFATPESAGSFKFLVLKINAHVSKDPALRYGVGQRYRTVSYYCSALRAFLDEVPGPVTDELREIFASEGKDRMQAIREIDPSLQPLAVAIASARLQARQAVLDLQDLEPQTPTLYLITPCVTLNRPDRDTELFCGYYIIDRRKELRDTYQGLGDDPSAYRFQHRGTQLCVTDDEMRKPRSARDHRGTIRQTWQKRAPSAAALGKVKELHSGHTAPKALLKALVFALAAASGVPAALILFAEGLVGIHNVWRAHRLARQKSDGEAERRIIQEFEGQLDTMPPERARKVADALLTKYATS